MRVEASVLVDRPRVGVWRYLAAPANAPKYWGSLERLKALLERQRPRA